jgi:predicted HicB family RNase H-like nuclease
MVGMSATGYDSFTVRVPKAVAKRLRKVAERELSSLNREVNIAIRAHLDASERGQK